MAQGEVWGKAAWDRLRATWRERLREWVASGKSQSRYCRERGLNPNTFSGWKRRLRWQESDGGRAVRRAGVSTGPGAFGPKARFTQLTVRGEAGHATPGLETKAGESSSIVEIVLRNGRVVRAGIQTPVESLARLAQALEQ